MPYPEDSPFYQLLATKYAAEREDEAIEILNEHPEIARLEWPGPDSQGQPSVKGSTALHYAANDGKPRLVRRLIECGADVNASNACWFRSVLSWASNNARVETIKLLLEQGAGPDSLDALHAAAWAAPLVERERNGNMPIRSSCLLRPGPI
jgi:ankyrin repeat protein